MFSQVVAAQKGGPPPLSVGGYFSTFAPDYGPNRLYGLGVYADLDVFHHLGAEGEVRFLRFHQSSNIHEDHYLVGPRYSFQHGRFSPYVKFLIGAGELNYQDHVGHSGFFAIAPGGGVDYRLSRHFNLRADYEYQYWPSAPALPGFHSSGMTPQGWSFGGAYRLF